MITTTRSIRIHEGKVVLITIIITNIVRAMRKAITNINIMERDILKGTSTAIMLTYTLIVSILAMSKENMKIAIREAAAVLAAAWLHQPQMLLL